MRAYSVLLVMLSPDDWTHNKQQTLVGTMVHEEKRRQSFVPLSHPHHPRDTCTARTPFNPLTLRGLQLVTCRSHTTSTSPHSSHAQPCESLWSATYDASQLLQWPAFEPMEE